MKYFHLHISSVNECFDYHFSFDCDWSHLFYESFFSWIVLTFIRYIRPVYLRVCYLLSDQVVKKISKPDSCWLLSMSLILLIINHLNNVLYVRSVDLSSKLRISPAILDKSTLPPRLIMCKLDYLTSIGKTFGSLLSFQLQVFNSLTTKSMNI